MFPGSILIARALGPEGRGGYQVPVTIGTIALTIGGLGIAQAQLRVWDSDTRRQLAGASALFGLSLGGLTLALALGIFLVGRDGTFADLEFRHVLIAASSLPLQVHSAIMSSLLQLAGHLKRVNVALAISSIGQVLGVYVLFPLDLLTVDRVLGLYVLGAVIQWLLLWSASRSERTGRAPVEWRLARGLLRIGISMQPYLVSQFLLLRIDVIFLARYRDLAEVGLYSIAVLFAELVWLGTDALPTALVQRVGNASPRVALRSTVRVVRANLLLATCAVLLISAFSPLGIRVLYGPAFDRSATLVLLLAPGIAAMAVWRATTASVLRLAPTWAQSVITGVALATNLVGNLLLVPSYGARGAAIATSMSYALGALMALSWLARRAELPWRSFVPGRADVTEALAVLGRGRGRPGPVS